MKASFVTALLLSWMQAIAQDQHLSLPQPEPGLADQAISHKDTRLAQLSRDDVLSTKNGQFYLEGQPFGEISFNKFDAFWQLYDQLAQGKPLIASNPLLQAQDKALRDLHELGFRSIRIFGLPWGPAGPASYTDPEKRKNLYAALDKTFDLCDAHDIRVVVSLGAATFTDAKLEPGKGWSLGEEQERELISNAESRNRKLLYRYLDETVARYLHRKTVLMWEISNEVTLLADIGDARHVYEGKRMPSLKQVASFFDDVATRIKYVDPLRLVSSGGSRMRESQWHLYVGHGWKPDTLEQQYKCFELLYGTSAIDIVDIHSYPDNQPGYKIAGQNGKPVWLGHKDYVNISKGFGKPLIIGELGLQPFPRTSSNVWRETPDYFDSYDDIKAAKPWLVKTLDDVIESGVLLTYWWCYQSDRPVDQQDPQRFSINRDNNPELINCFVEANKKLKAKLRSSSKR